MVQRISIALPDGLHDRLQAVKDSINVSGVCQGALQARVEHEERKREQPEDPTVKQAIERLRAEKADYGKKYREQGKEAGREDAKSLEYADLVAIANVLREHHTDTDIRDLRFDYNDWLEEPVRQGHEHDAGFDEDEYMDGWLEGVLEFFEKV